MAAGLVNEHPQKDNLKTYPCIYELFEVGLLQSRTHPEFGVSPDKIAIIDVTGQNKPLVACVEIKKASGWKYDWKWSWRVKKLGNYVLYSFDNDYFRAYMPSEDWRHVHFVTVKLEDGVGPYCTISSCPHFKNIKRSIWRDIGSKRRMSCGMVA